MKTIYRLWAMLSATAVVGLLASTMQQSDQKERKATDKANDAADDDKQAKDSTSGKTPSSAPNASFDTGAGEGATGFDSPEKGSYNLSNQNVDGVEHVPPYYPDGQKSYSEPTATDKIEKKIKDDEKKK